jgi:hypothetical protein
LPSASCDALIIVPLPPRRTPLSWQPSLPAQPQWGYQWGRPQRQNFAGLPPMHCVALRADPVVTS